MSRGNMRDSLGGRSASDLNGESRSDELLFEEEVEVRNFELPSALDASDVREHVRRYATIAIDPDDMPTVGGSGMVLEALDAYGEPLALKMLRLPDREPGQSDEEYSRVRDCRCAAFREEFALLSRLSAFTQFPDAYGYGMIGDVPVILMEWIEGVSLEQLLQYDAPPGGRSDFRTFDVANIGRSLFGVLQILEECGEGFVHRDLSPANVIWRVPSMEDGRFDTSGELDLCLIDFGSSDLDVYGSAKREATASSLKGTTPEYAPPEMLVDDLPGIGGTTALRNSPKVDVYAACSILYELITGDTPFRLYASGQGFASDWAQRKQQFAHKGDFPITRSASEALLAIVMQGLAPRQDDRPDASTLHDACARFMESYGWCEMEEADEAYPAPIDSLVFLPSGARLASRPVSDDPFNKSMLEVLDFRHRYGEKRKDISEEGAGTRFDWWTQRHFALVMALAFIAYTIAVLNVGYGLHELM